MAQSILLVTMRALDHDRPYADTLRFLKLRELYANLGYKVITVQRNNRFRFESGGKNDVYKLPALPGNYLGALCLVMFGPMYLRRVVRLAKPKVIFINSLFYARFLTKDSPVPINVDIMGLEHREKPLGGLLFGRLSSGFLRQLELKLVRKASFLTTVNEAHREALKTLSDRPAYVLRDGVNANTISKAVALPPQPTLIFVGSIANKRLGELFAVAQKVCQTVPNFKFLIVGDGPDRAYYEAQAVELGLEKRFTFTGYVDHAKLGQYLARATIGYSDDWSEIGFPTKVFEYMAAGKAVVTKNTSAVREVIDSGKNGLLYDTESELEEQLVTVSRNHELALKLAKAGLKDSRLHTWEARQKELTTIYRRALSAR